MICRYIQKYKIFSITNTGTDMCEDELLFILSMVDDETFLTYSIESMFELDNGYDINSSELVDYHLDIVGFLGGDVKKQRCLPENSVDSHYPGYMYELVHGLSHRKSNNKCEVVCKIENQKGICFEVKGYSMNFDIFENPYKLAVEYVNYGNGKSYAESIFLKMPEDGIHDIIVSKNVLRNRNNPIQGFGIF